MQQAKKAECDETQYLRNKALFKTLYVVFALYKISGIRITLRGVSAINLRDAFLPKCVLARRVA
ncbi:MAG: hypothetical protein ACXU8A_14815, partial [Burkholderiaceae bacterium]